MLLVVVIIPPVHTDCEVVSSYHSYTVGKGFISSAEVNMRLWQSGRLLLDLSDYSLQNFLCVLQSLHCSLGSHFYTNPENYEPNIWNFSERLKWNIWNKQPKLQWTDPRVSSLQFGFSSPADRCFTPESCSWFSLRFRSVRWGLDFRAAATTSQWVSESPQLQSLSRHIQDIFYHKRGHFIFTSCIWWWKSLMFPFMINICSLSSVLNISGSANLLFFLRHFIPFMENNSWDNIKQQ